MSRRLALAAALAAALACAPALREPAPLVRPPTGDATADEALRNADAAWARRADPAQARNAQDLYLQAASLDERHVDGLLGAMRATSWRIEREDAGPERARLAASAVQLGQWCQRRDPASAECSYRLAIALGQQARERTSTAKDALERMVKLLREAIAKEPRLDRGGPHRVLALVLLRAPGWPLGPGDPGEALEQAKAATGLFPADAENQLALGEALAANGRDDEARTALGRAATAAEREAAGGDPDAPRVQQGVRAAQAKLAR